MRALAIALLLGACGTDGGTWFGTSMPRHGPDELWLNNGQEPEWFDPGLCSDSSGGEIAFNAFAGLLQPDPATLKPMPDLAERWDLDDGGRTVTFHLRESRWSDGTPVTAHDFAWSWRRVLDPATGSKYASAAYVLLGGNAFNERALVLSKDVDRALLPADARVETGRAAQYVYIDDATKRATALAALQKAGLEAHPARAEDVGVEALDDRTLRVRLENPVPYFFDLLAFYTFMPVPRHLLERLQREGIDPNLWTRPEHIVTNGPYVLKEWRFRQHMLFEKNPHYWDAEHVRTPRIKVLEVESYNTNLNYYRSGEIDWTGAESALPAEFMDHLSQFKDFHRDAYLTVYYYWLNTTAPPLDDVRVRKALALAIDREALVTHITRAKQVPSADLVPDGLAGYQGLKRPLFDPEKARALLAESGHPRGEGLAPITLIYNTSEGHKQIAEAVQQMWKQHLGLEVQIENQEWKVFLKNLQLGQFQIARLGWTGDYPDPFTFLEVLSQHNGNNHSRWKSDAYDQLLSDANAEADPARRLALFRKAEELALDQQPLIPFYVYTKSYMLKPYVRGHHPNYQDRHPWKNLWIDPEWRP